MEQIFFKKNVEAVEDLKKDLRKYAEVNKLVFQEENASDNETNINWVCQMKKDSNITLGIANKAVTVTIKELTADTVQVQIGEAKWVSKIAGGLLGVALSGGILGLVLIPTAAVGAYKQSSLIKEVKNVIKIRLQPIGYNE